MLNIKSKMKPRKDAIRRLRHDITRVVIFVGVIWVVFGLDWFLPLEDLTLIPRTLSRLVGIVAMPFLHLNFRHLLSNTVPLLVLLSLLASTRSNTWQVVTWISLLGGTLLWLFGNPIAILKWAFTGKHEIIGHAGASLLIFGLISFLVTMGFRDKRPLSVLIAVLVGCIYGFSFLIGILPFLSGEGVSWEGHLAGGVAGMIVAIWQSSEQKFEASRLLTGVRDLSRS